MKKYRRFIIQSIIILGLSAAAGYFLRGIQISQETYQSFAGNPVFIIVSVLPFIGCLVFGFIIGKKYYNQEVK